MVEVISLVNIDPLGKEPPKDANHVHVNILLRKFEFLNLAFIYLKLLQYF